MRKWFLLTAICLLKVYGTQAEQPNAEFLKREENRHRAEATVPKGYHFEWSWLDPQGKPVRKNLWGEILDAYHDEVAHAVYSYTPDHARPMLRTFPEFLRARTNGELEFQDTRGQLWLIPKEQNRKSNLDVPVDLDLDNGTFWEGLASIALQINKKGRAYGAYFTVGFERGELMTFEAFTQRCITLHVRQVRARDVLCEMLNQGKLGIRLVYVNKASSHPPYSWAYLDMYSDREPQYFNPDLLDSCARQTSRLQREIMAICGLGEDRRPLAPAAASPPSSSEGEAGPPPSAQPASEGEVSPAAVPAQPVPAPSTPPNSAAASPPAPASP